MARLLWCRFEDCREAYVSDAGKVPPVCPACNRPAHWTTDNPIERPSLQIPVDGKPPSSEPFPLTNNDRRFLKSLRILNDWPDQDDGA